MFAALARVIATMAAGALAYAERDRDYTTLMQNVAGRLRSVDVDSIVNRSPGLAALRQFEERGVFGAGNIQPLVKLLDEIDRHDVVEEFVEPYAVYYGKLQAIAKLTRTLTFKTPRSVYLYCIIMV